MANKKIYRDYVTTNTSMVNKLPSEQECPVDNLIMPFIDTHLGAYKALGLTPNMVTTLGLICGLL